MLRGLNTGLMDRRIILQDKITVPDDDGVPQDDWANLYTNIPAQRKYNTVNEQDELGKSTIRQVQEYTIRYVSGITVFCRVVEEGRVYNIRGIEEIGRRQGLILKVEAID